MVVSPDTIYLYIIYILIIKSILKFYVVFPFINLNRWGLVLAVIFVVPRAGFGSRRLSATEKPNVAGKVTPAWR